MDKVNQGSGDVFLQGFAAQLHRGGQGVQKAHVYCLFLHIIALCWPLRNEICIASVVVIPATPTSTITTIITNR